MRLLVAHIDLLKAELAVTGRDLGIIVAMGIGAVSLVLVALLLIAIGTFLFLGEWLFGSMAWGILHGSLFLALLIVPIAIDLAGGWNGAWISAVAVGLVTTLVLWILFASNVLRDTAVNVGVSLESSVRLEPAVLPTLVGLVAGAVLFGVVLALVGSRSSMGVRLGVTGLILGAIVGAILGSVTFDTKGALAVAYTIGLVTAIADRRSCSPSVVASTRSVGTRVSCRVNRSRWRRRPGSTSSGSGGDSAGRWSAGERYQGHDRCGARRE